MIHPMTPSMPSDLFGSDTPFSEPSWYRGFASPYYNDTHRELRKRVRLFVDIHIRPFVSEWESQKHCPKHLQKLAYDAGLFSMFWPVEYGGTPVYGEMDIFHELIYFDELGRCAAGGVGAVFAIITMALPPILNYGSEYLKDTIARSCIMGDKCIALCITEPWAGSDVSQIRTSAVRDGDFYIINGIKKYITTGTIADYFTVATKTEYGITLFVIDRYSPGVKVVPMQLQGQYTAGTAVVTFDDVRVSKDNLIGKEDEGFKALMLNFNHERFVMAVQAARGCRIVLEQAILYANKRETFGKKLIEHQVIRHKIAEMARRADSCQAMVEQLAFQMKSKSVSSRQIGAFAALVKVHVTKSIEYVVREASQILGGVSYVQTGVGEIVERAAREVRAAAIPGGSEEIMMELAAKQSHL